MDYLFKFLQTSDVIGDVLAGYFNSAISALLQKRQRAVITYFYKSLDLKD
jgi:hypothetical protein